MVSKIAHPSFCFLIIVANLSTCFSAPNQSALPRQEDGDESVASGTPNNVETLAGVGSLVSQILGGVGALGSALKQSPPQQVVVAAPAPAVAAQPAKVAATAASVPEDAEDEDDDIVRL